MTFFSFWRYPHLRRKYLGHELRGELGGDKSGVWLKFYKYFGVFFLAKEGFLV